MKITEDDLYRAFFNIRKQLRKSPEKLSALQENICSKSIMLSRLMQEDFSDTEKIELLEKVYDFPQKLVVLLSINDKNFVKDYIKKENIPRGILKQELENISIVSQELSETPNVQLKSLISQMLEKETECLEISGIKGDIIRNILNSDKYKNNIESLPTELKRIATEELGHDLEQGISNYERVGINEDIISEEQAYVGDRQNLLDKMEINCINVISDRQQTKRISIEDFAGTLYMNSKNNEHFNQGMHSWKWMWENLKRSDEYMQSAQSENYSFTEENFKNLEQEEKIQLLKKGTNVYIDGNGNHRMTFLKLRYLSEKVPIENRDDHYTFDISGVKEIPDNVNEIVNLNLLMQIHDTQEIHEIVSEGKRVGYKQPDSEIELIGIDALNNYVNNQLKEIRKQDPERYQKIIQEVESRIMETNKQNEYLTVLREIQDIVEDRRRNN